MSPSDYVSIPIVCDPPVVSNALEVPPLPTTLLMYNRRQTSHCPLDDSLLVEVPPYPLTPTVESALPLSSVKVCALPVISLRIILLSYHRLSQPWEFQPVMKIV